MASSSILVSEEQVQCSICVDVFTKPVSTPCGHNFCMACIRGYWDTTDLYYCPLCKEKFNTRPEVRVNTFIAEMAAQMKRSGPDKAAPITPKQALINPGTVPCDVCTGPKFSAVKSCLVCLASYCETHLESHRTAPALKKHKQIEPVDDLEDRVCKKHGRLLELFCRDDQVCVCQFCMEGDHKGHKTVSMEEEFWVRKAQVGETRSEMQKMIQEIQQKVEEMKSSEENSKTEAEKEISESTKAFTALVRSIESCQAELIEAIEKKQKAAEKKTGEMIKELEQNIAELQNRSAELEQLSHNEDHLSFLQSDHTLSTLPHAKDCSEIRVDVDLCVGPVRRAVSQLEETLHKEITGVKLRMVKRCAVDVTLDPDTANPQLVLSQDGKQVRLQQIYKRFPDNPDRFDPAVCVLGKEGFSSGRFYYEVQVRGKTGWALGVARESINRKGAIERSPVKGHWALGLWGDGDYIAHAGPDVHLSLRVKPQKVGVFVDYEEGEVTFYDVEARSQIYSFTGCSFTERLYPCFSTGLYDDGKNTSPLIICPVSHRH